MLRVEGLRVNFGQEQILRGIDLELREGKTLAIIGESGTGKTTLGLALMGLLNGRVSGQIDLDGQNLLLLPEDGMRKLRWRRIAMAFQNARNQLNPTHTVLDQVAEPIMAHGLFHKAKAKERSANLLSEAGLPFAKHSRYPHELSGGEQQRVLLAMALAGDPEVLILDEPISSLDASSRIEVLSFLEKALAGRAVLVVTHDLSTAAKLSRETATLYAGRIVELGPTEKVLSEPRHPYTRALVRSYPEMTTGKDLQGIKGQMNRRATGCPFHPRCTQQMALCREQAPPLTEHNGRLVACHRGGIIPVLVVEKISKRFGPLKAVDEVRLTVQHGETMALVGQSGSGKTTLARIITGILKPDSGEVYLEMERVRKRGKDFHRTVQMVFQNPGEALSHRLTVLESVMQPLDIQGIGAREERVRRAKTVIGEVELPISDDFLNEYPHHLSGGELQRVNIARALVLEPKVLIADEPTSFLDAGLQAKVLKLLLNLQESRGLAMLFITHDIAVARKVSDRIAVMLEGRIVEEGLASRVIAHPSHSYTKRLIEAASGTSASSEQGQPVLGEVLNELPELRGRNDQRGCL